MKFRPWVAVLLLTMNSVLLAQNADDAPKTREQARAVVSTLKFQQGSINLQDKLATVNVPSEMRFLNGHDAGVVLTKLWHNPPEPDPLGMLVPANCDLLSDCWAVVITYENEGYVKDDDANKIDYPKLLKQMEKDTSSGNAERKEKGFPAIQLVGWAEPPRYDRPTHKLYWAKDLKFEGETDNTLNYNIRVLGRRGVLNLNAVANMGQLEEIRKSTPPILDAVEFNPGNRYADFNPASGDKVATYGIAALIAGGIAAKVGLFKGIWVGLIAAKKFILIAVVAIVAWTRKFFSGRTSKTGNETAQPRGPTQS
jgi:uncharacterized membrane-anchored protein